MTNTTISLDKLIEQLSCDIAFMEEVVAVEAPEGHQPNDEAVATANNCLCLAETHQPNDEHTARWFATLGLKAIASA